jgi:hypothetical protein
MSMMIFNSVILIGIALVSYQSSGFRFIFQFSLSTDFPLSASIFFLTLGVTETCLNQLFTSS